jgi:hypothetical protein
MAYKCISRFNLIDSVYVNPGDAVPPLEQSRIERLVKAGCLQQVTDLPTPSKAAELKAEEERQAAEKKAAELKAGKK